MKLFQIASAICLIVLIGQTSAFRILQSDLPVKEKVFIDEANVHLDHKENVFFSNAEEALNLKEIDFFNGAKVHLNNKENDFFNGAYAHLDHKENDFFNDANKKLNLKEDAFFSDANRHLIQKENIFLNDAKADLNRKENAFFNEALEDLKHKQKAFFEQANTNLHLKEKLIVDDANVNLQLKEKVFVNRAKPIIVNGQSRRVVVPASKPIVIKPEAVVIRQKGDVEVRPIHITRQPPPVIVTKKIVRLHRPVIKKFYVEQYRKKEEGAGPQIISEKVSKKTCDCPAAEHVINPNYNFAVEDNLPLPKGTADVVVEEDF